MAPLFDRAEICVPCFRGIPYIKSSCTLPETFFRLASSRRDEEGKIQFQPKRVHLLGASSCGSGQERQCAASFFE